MLTLREQSSLRMKVLLTIASICFLAAASTAVANSTRHTTRARKPLYFRMGGRKTIAPAVSDFIDRLASDPRLLSDPAFRKIRDTNDLAYAKKQVTTKVCELSGGPCRLKGPILKAAPDHVAIQPVEWLYVIQDLNTSLEHSRIPKPEQREALALLLDRKAQLRR